ncbi:MAG: F-box protein [Verrucomicrobia bacterium]|nr:F-box protein [Verrucomicrobiota bacterium]
MAVKSIEFPTPILPLSLGSFSTLPPECFVHILSFLPPPTLARLCLTHRDLRTIVNEDTQWGKAKKMGLIFHSLTQKTPNARSGTGYVLDVQRNRCSIQMPSMSQDLFPDHQEIEIVGTYKVSRTRFICFLFIFEVYTYFGLAGSFRTFEFTIGEGLSLSRAAVRSISEFEDFKAMTICRIYEMNRWVHIEASEGKTGRQYLFIHAIETYSAAFCLGKRIYTAEYNKKSSTCILKTDPKKSVNISLRPHLSSILYVQDPWLVAKHFSKLENKVHYVFYHTRTGDEFFCYSQALNKQNPSSASSRPFDAQYHQPQKVFIKGNFCLLYDHTQAVLILLDKQSIVIPLTKDTQNLFCSLDQIIDLDYQLQPEMPIKVLVEGERNFEKIRIESAVDPQSLLSSMKDTPPPHITLDSSTLNG